MSEKIPFNRMTPYALVREQTGRKIFHEKQQQR